MAHTVKSLKPIKAQLENGIEMVELFPGRLYLVRINKIPIADAQKLQEELAKIGLKTIVVDQTAEVYEIIEDPRLQAPQPAMQRPSHKLAVPADPECSPCADDCPACNPAPFKKRPPYGS